VRILTGLVLALVLVCVLVFPLAAQAAPADATIQGPNYSLFVPGALKASDKRPLVMVFSPNGDTRQLVQIWRPHAAKYKWFVLGFNGFRNGQDATPMVADLRAILKELQSAYPIDGRCLIATGFSGGGMFSHDMSALEPQAVVAIVVNTGMSHPQSRLPAPRNRVAVFLASPSDFRYQEMKADEKRLKALGWETKWIEFQGGHTIAPPAAYKEAADWLAGMVNWARSRKP
jgi:predicted esterase